MAVVDSMIGKIMVEPTSIPRSTSKQWSMPSLAPTTLTFWRAAQAVTRLLDGYTEGLLDKAEFEPRIRVAKQRLSELDAEHKLLLERETRDQQLRVVIHHLENFAHRVHRGLDEADATARRELICALVKRVEIGVEEIRVVYRIPLCPFDQSPTGGHLRHWVWRLDAAFFLWHFGAN